ncbi:uncharacterized protein G2W53_002136 [Senna tora]|uniref:Uncharacterized protein n=1 Tax=Senna tora TaxID=362788 RepID=A0A835CJ75_9FABA|nr:uncharacterized protein G2W53_002136 [Senna tora]
MKQARTKQDNKRRLFISQHKGVLYCYARLFPYNAKEAPAKIPGTKETISQNTRVRST